MSTISKKTTTSFIPSGSIIKCQKCTTREVYFCTNEDLRKNFHEIECPKCETNGFIHCTSWQHINVGDTIGTQCVECNIMIKHTPTVKTADIRCVVCANRNFVHKKATIQKDAILDCNGCQNKVLLHKTYRGHLDKFLCYWCLDKAKIYCSTTFEKCSNCMLCFSKKEHESHCPGCIAAKIPKPTFLTNFEDPWTAYFENRGSWTCDDLNLPFSSCNKDMIFFAESNNITHLFQKEFTENLSGTTWKLVAKMKQGYYFCFYARLVGDEFEGHIALGDFAATERFWKFCWEKQVAYSST